MKKAKILLLFFPFFVACAFLIYFFYQTTVFVIVKDDAKSYIYNENFGFITRGFSKEKVLAITENTLQTETKNGLNIYLKTDTENKFELLQESKVKFTTPKKIAILYISTGKYIRFWEDFYNSANKNFLPRHKKTFFLFHIMVSILLS